MKMPPLLLLGYLSTTISPVAFAKQSERLIASVGIQAEYRLCKEALPCVGREWFASFFDFAKFFQTPDILATVKGLSEHSIEGSFEHGNYGGTSFAIQVDPASARELNRFKSKLIGIWDFVECEKGQVDLVERADKSLFLRVHSLESCELIWD